MIWTRWNKFESIKNFLQEAGFGKCHLQNRTLTGTAYLQVNIIIVQDCSNYSALVQDCSN